MKNRNTISEEQQRIFAGLQCPYCGQATELIDSSEIYNGVSYGLMYICRPCNAYVGCYTGGKKALGMVANAELRYSKRKAHHYFDQLWRGKIPFISRFICYNWLSKKLDIPRQYTHIGMSDLTQCERIIDISIEKLKESGINPVPFDE